MRAAVLLAAFVAAACSTPAVTREVTTLGQVDLTGLECRTESQIDSHLAKTFCATPSAWKKWDRKMAQQTDDLFKEAGKTTNVDQFGRWSDF